MPLVLVAKKLLDVWGRRRRALMIYMACGFSVVAAYQMDGFWLLVVSLMGAIFAAVALVSLLNALTTELFSTQLRGDAFS